VSTTKQKKNGKYRTGGALLPVDLAILELLPDEGLMIGYKPLALQVRHIKDQPGFEEFTPGEITGRLKAMSLEGLIVSQIVVPLQKGLGYQRTRKGREALESTGKVVVSV
jgi:hypothetical protein